MELRSKKINISIVEDSLLSRISLKHSLSLYDEFKIISAFDSANDFIDANSDIPDVLLLDLDLKGINGIEATKLIKQKFPSIKIIILTEHSEKDFLSASMFFGARAFVIKSDNTDMLVKIIKAVAIGAYWIEPVFASFYMENFPEPDSLELFNLYKKSEMYFNLTRREKQVLKLLSQGKSNTEIAKEIAISANTAKAHVGNILSKMQVTDRVQAAVLAVKFKIV